MTFEKKIGSLTFRNLGSNTVVLGIGIIFMIPLAFIYQRETESRRLAENLADSLKKTGWLQRYSRKEGSS